MTGRFEVQRSSTIREANRRLQGTITRVTVARFSGTVVDCRTRFTVEKPTTAFLTHGCANWILTVAVETADAGLPFAAGIEKSFAIHSPVQLLFDSAEECVGKRYSFTVEIAEGRPKWITFQRA